MAPHLERIGKSVLSGQVKSGKLGTGVESFTEKLAEGVEKLVGDVEKLV